MPPALRSRKGPAPLQSGMFFHVTLVTQALGFLQPKEPGLLAILSLCRETVTTGTVTVSRLSF